jgi:hypothetical protein
METHHTKLVAEADALHVQLDELMRQFTEDLAEYVGPWFRETAADFVMRQHARTNALGSRLAELRQTVEREASELPTRVRDLLRRDEAHVWVHRIPRDVAWLHQDTPNALPTVCYDALEPITSEKLATTLTAYGYEMPHVPLRVPPQLIALMNSYKALALRWQNLRTHDIGYGEDEFRARAEAAELWERALS